MWRKSLSWALLLLAGAEFGNAMECGPKISPKLCAQMTISSNPVFKVRIVLDASKEGQYSKTEKRPLLVWTEHLLETYELFSISNPDSGYHPIIVSINPSIESVVYHNVSVEKSELEKIAAEPYVKSLEQGCSRRISHGLCTEMNGIPDTGKISFRAYFQDSLESDSVKLVAYLSKINLYHAKFQDSSLAAKSLAGMQQYGYCARVSDLKIISWDDEVRVIEQWAEIGPTSVKMNRDFRVRPGNGAGRTYRMDGRQLGQHGSFQRGAGRAWKHEKDNIE